MESERRIVCRRHGLTWTENLTISAPGSWLYIALSGRSEDLRFDSRELDCTPPQIPAEGLIAGRLVPADAPRRCATRYFHSV